MRGAMSRTPHVEALFEAHLTVSDLERSVAFYRDVVGLPVALELPARDAAFLWIGGPGTAMLGLWSLGSAPMGLSLHIALTVSLDDVLGACDALRSAGVAPLSFSGEDTDEPSVIGWMPAAAVYFRDPDGHLVEYLAMLDEPADAEAGIATWSRWRAGRPDAGRVRVERHTGRRADLRPLFEEAEDSPAALDAYLDAGEVLVAKAGDRVVGHAQLVDGGAELKSLAVEASWRRRGIGRSLVEAAADVARAQGRSALTVSTAAADTGNLRFYQRLGFRLRAVDRDVFTPAAGYAPGTVIDGIELRDRVWLDLDLAGTR
jgi:ribosomal protein S18 acetylase RimI-like enzyme